MNKRAIGWMLVLAGCGTTPTPAIDSSMPDGGVELDAASPIDAAPADAAPDASWTAPATCDATDVDVYTPPAGIPAFTTADRGRVISCGAGAAITAATSDARARERGYDGAPLTSGSTVTRVLYQSERKSGQAGFATGALYLPEGGATDAPLLIYVAGTTGLGDTCAPSFLDQRFEDFERAFYVLIGSGHAVFVPDLTGLGTPGTLSYLEPVDAGHAVLDGARAALEIAPAGALSGDVALAGHSAGGHAALAAQSFQREYAPELTVIGVSGVAAAWLDTSQFALLMYMGDYTVTDPNSGWNVVYAAMYFVGHAASYDGEDVAYDPIAPALRDQVRTLFETQCLDNPGGEDLRTQLAAIAPTVGALFEPTWRTSVSNCYLGISCDAVGTAWMARYPADRPALDPMGAPVWFHHGDADARIALPTMVCPIRAAMTADPRVQACIYEGATHNTVATEAAPWLIEWVDALGAGEAAPACPDAAVLPDCPT